LFAGLELAYAQSRSGMQADVRSTRQRSRPTSTAVDTALISTADDDRRSTVERLLHNRVAREPAEVLLHR
jgi:hypothetical protein